MIVFSEDAQRLPNTALFTVPGLKAETAVIGFDLGGICGIVRLRLLSGKVQPSHVLAAMGVGLGPGAGSGAVQSGLATPRQTLIWPFRLGESSPMGAHLRGDEIRLKRHVPKSGNRFSARSGTAGGRH